MSTETVWRRAWRRLRTAVFITVATRSFRITLEAARWHSLQPVSDFVRAGGKLGLDRAEYEGTELPLRPDAWIGLIDLGQLLKHGVEVRKAGDGFEISLASRRIFELPSERLLGHALQLTFGRFVADEYGPLEVAGAVVIDVGANIGDSAVYFADKGAVHVYAFEPFSEPYATAVRVVRRNQLEHMVTVIPRGVGARGGRGIATYNPTRSSWALASLHRSTRQLVAGLASNRTEEFELMSLSSVLDQACKDHPGRPLVLKMDCEGCEFEAFEGEGIRESLKPVKSILIEVHPDKCHQRNALWSKLEEFGFSVEELSPSPRRWGTSLLLAARQER